MSAELLKSLGVKAENPGACTGEWIETGGGQLVSENPTTSEPLASVRQATAEDYEKVVGAAEERFRSWRMVPAPVRGELVRDLGNELREHKDNLGRLVSLEMGKILSEGLGEVQEMIDICDFAVGLSRQLYGLSMHSERPEHRMYEQYHPLGPIGIITAFNFPVAVWVSGLFNLVIGRGAEVGERMLADRRVPLISATGSCRMGRRIAQVVGERLGRTLLELGGNNAVIVMDDADQKLALSAVLFGAVGTAGQRCTSTRRLILQKGIAKSFTEKLVAAYKHVRIGDPLDENTLMGPLVDGIAVNDMTAAMDQIKKQGGEILCGGGKMDRPGNFVEPTVVRANRKMEIWKDETFAPILYVFEVDDLEQAIELHNDVPQGLSSSIFTTNVLNSETFLSHRGSDCGIANINLGTSGAEIGGAFGGEKETGGGRESGSDAWKIYMRRQTNTINWGRELPLAQGVKFDI